MLTTSGRLCRQRRPIASAADANVEVHATATQESNRSTGKKCVGNRSGGGGGTIARNLDGQPFVTSHLAWFDDPGTSLGCGYVRYPLVRKVSRDTPDHWWTIADHRELSFVSQCSQCLRPNALSRPGQLVALPLYDTFTRQLQEPMPVDNILVNAASET